MDGCDFTSFSTVFQSYQDNGPMIMKDCIQWNPFAVEKILHKQGTRSVGTELKKEDNKLLVCKISTNVSSNLQSIQSTSYWDFIDYRVNNVPTYLAIRRGCPLPRMTTNSLVSPMEFFCNTSLNLSEQSQRYRSVL